MFGKCHHHEYPTGPFTTLELQNPPIDVYEQHKFRRFLDLVAPKLFKDRSGKVKIKTPCTLQIVPLLKKKVWHKQE